LIILVLEELVFKCEPAVALGRYLIAFPNHMRYIIAPSPSRGKVGLPQRSQRGRAP
jgi:hypothetical protein